MDYLALDVALCMVIARVVVSVYGVSVWRVSVFVVVSATFIKQPAEKSLLCHVQYLRELLDKLVLQYLFWIDTRDMGADGLTKGDCARLLLHLYMEGYMPLQHEFSQWSSKLSLVS